LTDASPIGPASTGGEKAETVPTLPGGKRAFVDVVKVRDYLLSETHPRGRHKARVFRAALGLERDDAERLADWFRGIAATAEASYIGADRFGSRWTIDADMNHRDRIAKIRSLWLVPPDEYPRLITAYVN
jgi:hypothetical protein